MTSRHAEHVAPHEIAYLLREVQRTPRRRQPSGAAYEQWIAKEIAQSRHRAWLIADWLRLSRSAAIVVRSWRNNSSMIRKREWSSLLILF